MIDNFYDYQKINIDVITSKCIIYVVLLDINYYVKNVNNKTHKNFR